MKRNECRGEQKLVSSLLKSSSISSNFSLGAGWMASSVLRTMIIMLAIGSMKVGSAMVRSENHAVPPVTQPGCL